MSLPTITCKGRLTRDIELRYTNAGKAVASFDVASSKTRLNPQTNQWEQIGDTLFLHCELWGTPAENLAETTAGKGAEVLITGELQANNWTDKQGNTRRDVKVRVDTIALTPARKPQASQSQYSGGGWNDPPQNQAFPQDAPF
ncbi:single-stranded DNA-binding protein [Mobiluncus curtisii]|uniref:single-stranded DNA-binding protein n=1 Tax=Mobiluncus curtisii TaxID=2051 RepID=UPI00242DB7AD|nr:single-stranded DNA-binding protein [Mobiluncus curtisii]